MTKTTFINIRNSKMIDLVPDPMSGLKPSEEERPRIQLYGPLKAKESLDNYLKSRPYKVDSISN